MNDHPRPGVRLVLPEPEGRPAPPPSPAQPPSEPHSSPASPPSSAWGGQDATLPTLPTDMRDWLTAQLESDLREEARLTDADMRAIMQDWSVVGVDLWAALGRGLYATTKPAWDEDRQGNLSWRGFLVWAIPCGLAAVLLVALVATIVRGGWW